MSNIEGDDSSMLIREFNLESTIENLKDGKEVFEEVFSENELDINFDELAFKFNNVLNDMLAHENEEDSEIESYADEYDHDIEIELEQDNNENDDDNELEEESDEIIPDEFDMSEGSINKKYNVQAAISPCVIIDNIQGTIKRCNETYKLRRLRNLLGTWQIDRDAVQQVDSNYLKLGVCDSHFLYDQNQIHNPKEKIFTELTDALVQHRRCIGCKKYVTFFSRGEGCSKHSWLINGRNIQVPCNGLMHCNALKDSFISKCAFEEIKKPRCICCSCYEQLGGHIHKRAGRGKKSNCVHDKLHEQDTSKGIEFIANWLKKISHTSDESTKREILKSITKAIIPFLPTTPTKTTLNNDKSDETLSLFIVKILFLDTFINNKKPLIQNEDTETVDYEILGQQIGIKLWKSRKAINDKKDLLNSPASLSEYYNAFPSFITGFFEGMLIEIFKQKLAVSNRQRKYRKQLTKSLSKDTIIKIVTFFVSVITSITFPSHGIWLTNVLSSLACKPKLLSSLHCLLAVWNVIGHSDRHERNQEKERISKAVPTKRLCQKSNIWNLAIIDNIDFKQKTFSFGNIYDTTRNSSHMTLRMAFQSEVPDHLVTNYEEIIALENDTRIFEIIKKAILAEFEHGCQGSSPHVIILEPGDNPNSDQAILDAANMYKIDFNLLETDYLDIVADEAIFRRLMRCQAQWPQLRPLLSQWHTSKDFCLVLIVLFSSYGLLNLARRLGVRFLDKFEAAVDYRTTSRVLDLL
ncbi:hypothetical protein GLOIN_2v1793246 [Rhizophagus clarus]|uniref:Uncharacterized protein n=1 Tax=Rhizophagus clarus TaxID=94130 RepID=A0A8H3QZW2_9GLOM|nr:hypothetical protein GLOIN_2v1793246 [Rhizophagus clarus]